MLFEEKKSPLILSFFEELIAKFQVKKIFSKQTECLLRREVTWSSSEIFTLVFFLFSYLLWIILHYLNSCQTTNDKTCMCVFWCMIVCISGCLLHHRITFYLDWKEEKTPYNMENIYCKLPVDNTLKVELKFWMWSLTCCITHRL